MRKTVFVILAMALVPFCAFGVDGTVLINQSTVMAAGGFPYRITQPGSYRLSGNLSVPDANTTAISIDSDSVTLDLNGFAIIGPTVCNAFPPVTCSPTGSGVGIGSFSHTNVTVMNGTVRGMGFNGVSLTGGAQAAAAHRIDRVNAFSNGNVGLLDEGDSSVITSNTAFRNRSSGIVANGTVTGNVANHNGGFGIGASGTVTGNVANGNGVSGLSGGGGATFSGNEASFNGSFGIDAACPSSVVGNRAVSNPGGNIFTQGSGCVLANNAAP